MQQILPAELNLLQDSAADVGEKLADLENDLRRIVLSIAEINAGFAFMSEHIGDWLHVTGRDFNSLDAAERASLEGEARRAWIEKLSSIETTLRPGLRHDQVDELLQDLAGAQARLGVVEDVPLAPSL